MNLALIIAAGGESRRFAIGNKLLEKINGKSVLCHSIEPFYDVCGSVIVAAPAQLVDVYRELLTLELPTAKNLIWVTGGETRAQSVRNALAAVPFQDGLIAVHDAARPLATQKLLMSLVVEATRCGAVIPAKPVVDTLKKAENNLVVGTVDRSALWAVETPQVFDARKLRQACETTEDFTDEAGAMEKAGFAVKLLENPEPNWKITRLTDLILARRLLENPESAPKREVEGERRSSHLRPRVVSWGLIVLILAVLTWLSCCVKF